MMDDDEKIDTAMEIKVLRHACEEEAKLRRYLKLSRWVEEKVTNRTI